ncbi:nucleoside-diphosphate kinase [Treponema zuelzerae]|uniref:Nucleoside diphosphate kinase n=1 Tax=Teretinema zuelzerae TaxID=156 RepID=A0AAE3EIU5_9SPIR|nr:nucleoside-diphosphate kinase [Teretinema zuelzerae]MCD1654304.1 nucleoside-diphosphate kinase [Teretinema zuelzerae]
MSSELSYVLFTPYTIARSRTGGVLSRLLVRLDLELVGAQMIAPTEELAAGFAKSEFEHSPSGGLIGQLKKDYILKTFTPSNGRRHRVLLLLFRGKDAVEKLKTVAGPIFPERRSLESAKGETIRDTYGDVVYDEKTPDRIEYFEPVVFTAETEDHCKTTLKLFQSFLAREQNLVENVSYDHPERIERTLVIIKPDNWVVPSSRPGTIIDMFSRTGLRIIGTKILQMSVAEALEFYGPVEEALREKLGPRMGQSAVEQLESKFSLKLKEEESKRIAETFGTAFAREQFYQIVGFMTGVRPDLCPEGDTDCPGKSMCMVLVYEGENAVARIREVLGPTDPLKAPAGTVRREFGSNVMVNTAHASDSPENALREMGIVKISKNNCAEIIERSL